MAHSSCHRELSCILQETELQHNVIDAVVLVLLSIAGPDQKTNLKAAGGGLPKAVSTVSSPRAITHVIYNVSVIVTCFFSKIIKCARRLGFGT